jgi:hypothetical protein
MGNCQVDWLVNNGYIPLKGVTFKLLMFFEPSKLCLEEKDANGTNIPIPILNPAENLQIFFLHICHIHYSFYEDV